MNNPMNDILFSCVSCFKGSWNTQILCSFDSHDRFWPVIQPVTHTLNTTFSSCKASICKVCSSYQNTVEIKLPMLFTGPFDRTQVFNYLLLLVIIYIYIFLISCHTTWPKYVPTFSYGKHSNTCKISGFITSD
jgi:hypothetical protein